MKRHPSMLIAGFAVLAVSIFTLSYSYSSTIAAAAANTKDETATGKLEVIAECEETDGRNLYFLISGNDRLKIDFTSEPKRELRTGMQVSLRGSRRGDVFRTDENTLQFASNENSWGDAAGQTSSLTATTGEIKVLVLLVNFQDNPTSQPVSLAQMNTTMFDSASKSVANFYRETSYGQTWVTGDTYGWLTLNMNASCDYTTIASKAKQAAQSAGVNLSAYNHYVYAYPNAGCSYSGLGTVGGNEAWVVGTFTRQNIAHEMGHNLGLQHARYLDCGNDVVGLNCTYIEYGHILDTMGGGAGQFHSYNKELLGWVDSTQIQTITQNGNYLISPIEITGGVKALKILRSNGSYYYVELRRPVGFDSGISGNTNLMNGVMINLNSSAIDNYMLDLTPETTTRSDPALTVNRTYTDTTAGVSITPLSVSDSGAVVNVSFAGAPSPTPTPTATPVPTPSCVMANPSITVGPASIQWVTPGSSASYSISITNNNSSSCSSNSFNLQGVLPNGWSISSTTPILAVAPGATSNSTIQVISPASTGNGAFTINLGASNSTAAAYAAFSARDIEVFSAPNVSVSADRTTYTTSQTAIFTARVSGNGLPLPGASVTFTIVKPNGKTLTLTSVSAADGSAVWSYHFNKRQDPVGAYVISVNVSLNGASGVASTNFSVR